MADQTDVAVYCGLFSAIAGAIFFKDLTGWSAWISFPAGAILGFLTVAISVFILIGIAGALFGKKAQAREDNDEAPPT